MSNLNLNLTQWSGALKFMDGREKLQTIYMAKGNTRPILNVIVYDEDKNPKDLSDNTITFSMMSLNSRGAVKVNASSCDLVDSGKNGKFTYDWGADDLDTSGWFLCEFKASVEGVINEMFKLYVRDITNPPVLNIYSFDAVTLAESDTSSVN